MRSIASTALNEDGGFSPDVIESALAHIEPNGVRRAYNRADYLERRAKLMAWWSELVESSITRQENDDSKITQISAAHKR